VENNPPLGNHWTKILRIGPYPINEGDVFPNVEMYFLPIKCQHCRKPECVTVCPTGASEKMPDGTVQIDKEKCIGCQSCVMACPYNVRYLNKETRVVEKCTMCEQLILSGGQPECVSACTGKALHFGDLDDPNSEVSKLAAAAGTKAHTLPDVGNKPSGVYVLDKQKWRL
jgi:Fe-S-cluster-containing dehydrogenase component